MKKHIVSILPLLFAAPLSAVTVWQPAPNALTSASWDDFIYENTTAGNSGSQGVAQASSGSLTTTSDLTTGILDDYNFPGGIGSNPSTYYIHNGGYEWTANLTLSESVSYVRVSYALLGTMGAPDPFANTPGITGASTINSGTYADGSNTIFFTDLELDAPTTDISATFGDTIFPNFPGSFRSIDGIQLEVFNTVPIPEPSSVILTLAGITLAIRRRR